MSDSLVRVYVSSNAFDGLLTKGHLEAEGITVLMKGEGGGTYRAGPVYLWVLAQDEANAREIVRAIESGAYATSDEDVVGTSDDAQPAADVADEQPLR
jgi:Putative prokaryotic signal transducing protein